MARIRRVWSATQIFFNEIFQHLCKDFPWEEKADSTKRIKFAASLKKGEEASLNYNQLLECKINGRLVPFLCKKRRRKLPLYIYHKLEANLRRR